MTDLLGVESIAAELRACPADGLPDVRASFEVIAGDLEQPAWWRETAKAAVMAIDRMGEGIDPAVTLAAVDGLLMAAREACLAGDGALAGSRSRARRRRRGPP